MQGVDENGAQASGRRCRGQPPGGLYDAAAVLLRRSGGYWMRPVSPGMASFAALRRAAASRFLEQGLPTRAERSWRLWPIEAVTRVPFGLAPPLAVYAGLGSWLCEVVPTLDGERRVALVDGRPIPEGLIYMAGDMEIRSLAQAAGAAELDEQFGRCADIQQGFVALNTALFSDGLFILIPRGAIVDEPLHVIVVAAAASTPSMSHPRILVIAGASSTATIVETFVGLPKGEGDAPTLTNAVTEVMLGEGATLDHLRVQDEWAGGYHVGAVSVRQSGGSRYRSQVVSLGSAASRLDLDVLVDGLGAECVLDGLWLAGGRQRFDHRLQVVHARPRTRSLLRYVGVAGDAARSVIGGRVDVRRGAAGAEARLETRGVLLSREARVDARPSLEVDVETEEASIARLQEETLCLGGDGIEEFLKGALDRIDLLPLRKHLASRILKVGDTHPVRKPAITKTFWG
ncbi:MAG: SufD family Fe-S cluster assembly protein [Deltaproteobacteria bacterium]|nr:SufD family Fe-S cluster assembly protein [Deltaproteobacteria bacterium]